ncbi:PpiC-type peptidyl-prolyl cis-trans isomerase [[Clostridium] cellulosi]|uniref:PpiC-type peptidyl-prolyl cis-trans isomerase n=1 Tax=[Clostridium] cellulosi TaxID=29343 RepID=A0A078KJ40_9FIRM|nr:MAG: hypothetical protein DIU81_02760 [[Clostridium] cellulosi]CDZ23631.1 PpiC-type peptidyl-prolyl cis-trans isomerase [[Clostridium] cellulosi]
MKRFTKICALVCALAASFSFSGCADTSWSLKSGDITMPTGVYVYFLMQNAGYVTTYAASSSSSSTSSNSDPWSQQIDGKNAVSWAINNALDSCKQLMVIEKQAAERKVTLTSDEKSAAKAKAEQAYTTYKDLFTKNGISQASIERYLDDMYLKDELFKSYYGEKGDKAVSASELADYYTKNFAHIKQIFVSKIDTSTYQPLSSDKLESQKKKANEAYAAVKNDLKNFQTYVDKYNEDTGMKQNPDGYIFSKQTAQSLGYDQKFVDLAFSLKEGEVGMAESDMGYFIEYRVKTDPSASSYNDSMKQTVLSEMKYPEFQNLLKDLVSKEKFTQNDKAINKFNPKKIKLS